MMRAEQASGYGVGAAPDRAATPAERMLFICAVALTFLLAASALAPSLLAVGGAAAALAAAVAVAAAVVSARLSGPPVRLMTVRQWWWALSDGVRFYAAPALSAAALVSVSLAAVLAAPLFVSRALPPYADSARMEVLFDGSSAPALVQEESYAASLRLSPGDEPDSRLPLLVLSPVGSALPELDVSWLVRGGGPEGPVLASGSFSTQASPETLSLILPVFSGELTPAAPAGGGCLVLEVTSSSLSRPPRELSVVLSCR